MTPDQINTLVQGLLGVGLAVAGWFSRQLWDAVQKLREDMSKLEIRISTDYVRYDRLQDVMKPIMAKLERIEDALTHKADRP